MPDNNHCKDGHHINGDSENLLIEIRGKNFLKLTEVTVEQCKLVVYHVQT